jgi:hypothetical protein
MAYRRIVLGVVAAGAAGWLLYVSHRSAYRAGGRNTARSTVTSVLQADEDGDSRHLYYEVLRLRIAKRHPAELPATDVEVVRGNTETFALGVETRVIPRLRREGRTEEADRQAALVEEARHLLAELPKDE